jgi:hypothetical protein
VPNDFELLGVRYAARARELALARYEALGPEHPDFGAGEPIPDAPVVDGEDVAVDFARVGHLVDRMRAAFFTDRS